MASFKEALAAGGIEGRPGCRRRATGRIIYTSSWTATAVRGASVDQPRHRWFYRTPDPSLRMLLCPAHLLSRKGPGVRRNNKQKTKEGSRGMAVGKREVCLPCDLGSEYGAELEKNEKKRKKKKEKVPPSSPPPKAHLQKIKTHKTKTVFPAQLVRSSNRNN